MRKLFILFVTVTMFALNSYGKDRMDIILKWQPSDDLDQIDNLNLNLFSKYKFSINVIDERTQKEYLGKNIENERKTKYVYTSTNIIEWIRNNFVKMYNSYGVNLYKDGNYTLNYRVLDFSATEENIYNAILKTKLEVVDNSTQKIVWQTMIITKSRPWGGSFEEEMYQRCLSNVIIQNIREFLNNIDFYRVMDSIEE